MATIFSRIASGEIPSYKIAEDERFFAFLDINPHAEGHTLVIPKQETDYIFDLNHEDYRAFWDFARRVATALERAVPCKRIGIAVVGLEVPHAHIHLIPLNVMNDMNFSKPVLKLSEERFRDIADRIRKEFH